MAARQGGVVSAAQLRAAGIDGDAARRRVAAGRLHRLGRGVYAVGHTALSPDGRLFAALLGVGEGGVVSHRTAADLWGFAADRSAEGRCADDPPGSGGERVRLHRTRDLPPRDVTRLRGIPVTSVPRTLVDLSAVLDARRLDRAVHEAEVLRLLDVTAVEDSPGAVEGKERHRPPPGADHDRGSRRPGPSWRALFLDALPFGPPADAGGERDRRRLRGRLPLARATAHRRDRRPRGARHATGVRARPQARHRAHEAAASQSSGSRGDASRPSRKRSPPTSPSC